MNAVTSAYTAIGRAVCAAQKFEIVFVVSAELFQMLTEPEYRAITQGLFNPGHLKTPTKNLLKRLAERNEISPSLEIEVASLLEDRHLLIHRWHVENGFAGPEDPDFWRRYEVLAVRVEETSTRITQQLLSYILKWAEPDWARANPDEYLARMKQLFHLAAAARSSK